MSAPQRVVAEVVLPAGKKPADLRPGESEVLGSLVNQAAAGDKQYVAGLVADIVEATKKTGVAAHKKGSRK